MSTRVHELAKELGLKSPELIEKIQTWGLDVKASALASLDPGMVERIKVLHEGKPAPAAAAKDKGPAKAPEKATAPSPPPRAPSPATATVSPPETPPIRPTTAAPPRSPAAPSAQPTPHPAPAVAEAPAPPAAPPKPAPAAPAPAVAAIPVAPPAPAPAAPAVARPSGLTTPPRAAVGSVGGSGGPLASHTPHRTSLGAGSGPLSRNRVGGGPADYRPNPTAQAPLRPSGNDRGDYISPTGARGPVPPPTRPGVGSGRPPLEGGPRPVAGPPPIGPRRPMTGTGGPPTIGPPPRRPDGSRPAAGPEVKTQRPDVRYTPAQLMEMARSGQLNAGGAPAAPPRPGSGMGPRPAGSGMGPRPVGPPGSGLAGRGPAGPGLAPGIRRPPGSGLGPGLAPPPVIAEDDDKKKGAAGRLGTPADRANRRLKRNDRAKDRAPGSTEDDSRPSRGPRRGGRGRQAAPIARKTHAEIEPPITLRTFSEATGIKGNELIRKLMNTKGQLFTINAGIDDDLAMELAMEFGVELNIVYERTLEDDLQDAYDLSDGEAEAEGMESRPPIITILGHVDHGKTSLLDKIRKANVVSSESGGITQHIGAYQVEQDGKKITFVDTPGHEAFTAMRARGANVTDIVVLVVAADDGVMPQTQEAIAHAKAADVPVVVALNKIDLPGVDSAANIAKIYGELSQQGLIPTEYGGETEVVRTSTFTGQGIPDLLQTLALVAELLDMKAHTTRPAVGTCLEASKSEGRGVLATVLVQDGTLSVGDILVCGDAYGRVRALFDDKGKSIQHAPPSTPVEVSGLDSVPSAGERFAVVDDIGRARELAENRRLRTRGVSLGDRVTVTLENLHTSIAQQKVKSLNLILKADVQGSLEALLKELEKLENPEVPIRVLLKGVGGISESDILLADASQAIVIGFRVAPEDRAVSLADEKKIEIRRYDIIYQVTDEIKKAVEGLLVPEIKEVHLGRAQVRQVFKISKIGTVSGCIVTQGTIERSSKARIIREGREIYKGTIDALKRFKDDAKEVREGFECGIKVSNFDDVKVDDTIEAYRIDVIRRTLANT